MKLRDTIFRHIGFGPHGSITDYETEASRLYEVAATKLARYKDRRPLMTLTGFQPAPLQPFDLVYNGKVVELDEDGSYTIDVDLGKI